MPHHEVQLASVTFGRTDLVVETIPPVETEHAHDRKIKTDADADGTFDREGIEVLPRRKTVTTFRKYQTIDRRAGLP